MKLTGKVPIGGRYVEELDLFQVRDGVTLKNVHKRKDCKGAHCIIHNPSDHHMRDWPLVWRGDKRMFERTCRHGVGHPDPDGYYPNKSDTVHGCDGCCQC